MTGTSEQTGGMVALLPDAATAKRLVTKGGDSADKLHLTLAYLGDDVTDWSPETRSGLVDGIGKLAATTAPVAGRVLGRTAFNADGGPDGDTEPCTVYLIGDAQGLDGLLKQVRAEIVGAKAGMPEQREPFVAHVTAGQGLDPENLPGSGPVRFDRLVVALADDWQEMPLKRGVTAMAASAVRTPLSQSPALELGHKLWRKQIIREGKIAYRGGEFDASPDYLDSVVASFRDRALGSVPFVFVDDKGAHSEAPERRRGKVIGLERTPDGIDALLQLSDDAEKLVEDDPEFGVSVLIKHDRTTGEGKYHPAVLCHVAGTYDPVLSLKPWTEELAASNPGSDDVLDLLALTAPRESQTTPDGADPDAKEKAAVPLTLTDEQVAAVQALLPVLTAQAGISRPPVPAPAAAPAPAVASDVAPAAPVAPAAATVQPADPQPADQPPTPAAPEPNTDDESDDDGEDNTGETPAGAEVSDAEFTDAELDEIARALTADETAPEPELVAASNNGDVDALQLSHDLRAERQARERLELRLAQVEQDRDNRVERAERERWARDLGIAPRLFDIVAPVLRSGGGQVALSNGQTANTGDLVRRFVTELHGTGFLDLSLSQGSAIDVDEDKAADEETARKAAAAAYVSAAFSN